VPLSETGIYEPSSLVNLNLQTRNRRLWIISCDFCERDVAFKMVPTFRVVPFFHLVSPVLRAACASCAWCAIIDAGLRNGSLESRENFLCMHDVPEGTGLPKAMLVTGTHGFKIENIFLLGADVSPKELIEQAIALHGGPRSGDLRGGRLANVGRRSANLIQRLCDLPLR